MVTHTDIITSVNNGLILDDFVRQGTFLRNGRGRLVQYTGGFTDVFPVNVHGEKWAFRCWYANLGSTKQRFIKISTALSRVHLPYFCEFKYIENGIIINGQKYPTTRMRWIEGDNIKKFLCKHSLEKTRLVNLADRFMRMSQELHAHHIAHGDLQHGNIIVGNDDHIYLIDYDSVFVPTLNGQADIIHGLKGYQHPKRKSNKLANEKLDYFSELIIYTSILGIAIEPNLVKKYNVEDSEQLLFSCDDFLNITNSEIYKDLASLGGVFSILLKILVNYLSKNDINDLEPFEDLLVQNYKKISNNTGNRFINVNRPITSKGLHWLLISIDMQPSRTIFKWRIYSEEEWSYIYSNGTEYFTDRSSGKKYRVFKTNGIGSTANNPTFLREAKCAVEFFEYFPPLPSSINAIDYHMSDDNVIHNIDLTHSINMELNTALVNHPLQKGLSLNEIEEMARKGDVDSQLLIADMYYTGNILPNDYSMAAKWYKLATKPANSTAEYMLGNCYYYGHGVTQSYSQAVAWYYKAADHGNVEAENDLGSCYVNGDGVNQDFNKAISWYKRAISHGSEIAKKNLQLLMEATK